jgi:AraC-like DNA-binding protein
VKVLNERKPSLERIRSADADNVDRLVPRHRIRQVDVALSTDRPVRVQPLELSRPVIAHDHDYHEISLITAGRCRHIANEGEDAVRRGDVERGDVILIRPGDVHAFDRIAPGTKATNVYFLAEWLDADLNSLWDEPGLAPLFCSGALVQTPALGPRVFRLNDVERDAVERELAQLHAELSAARPGQAFMKSCFLKAAALISRAWCRSDPSWRETTFSPDVWRTLRAVERAIASGEPFALHAVAEARKLSVDRLSALFRDAVGFAPVEYFQRRRVQRACQLLADPRLSITEVAVSLGYADAPHFCRLFKHHRGLTPRAYRQTYGVNPETP